MDQYKLLVLFSALTPQVTSRIVRDLLAIQRLANVNKLELVVACDKELDSKVNALGLTPTRDHASAQSAFIYVEGEDLPEELEDRIPDEEECAVDIKYLAPNQAPTPGLVIESDPYIGMDIPEDRQEIPETMPLDRPAPKGNPGEPPLIPFL
jgi:hypothetical protein